MPKSETSNPNEGPSFQAPRYRPNWPIAIVCFLLATWMLVAMINYSPNQIHKLATNAVANNVAGSGGAYTAYVLFFAFGFAAWSIPAYLYRIVYLAIRSSKHLTTSRYLTMLLSLVSWRAPLARCLFER